MVPNPPGPPNHDPNLVPLREILDLRWNMHKELHAADQRAVDLALRNLNERLEGMNQFRAQLDRQAALFVDRDYLITQLNVLETSLSKDINQITARQESFATRIDLLEKNAANMAGRLWAAGVTVGTIFTLLSLFLKFFVP